MGETKKYTIHSVKLAAGSPIQIQQVSQQSIDPGITQFLEGSDGEVDNRFVALNEQRPAITFTSTAIKTVLDACGISGRSIDGTTGAMELFMKKLADGGTRSSSSDHIKVVANKGLLIPQTLTASQGQRAEISLMAHITYNGTNDPLVISSASIAGDVGTETLWTVGPVNINGATLDNVSSITVDFGIQVFVEAGSGDYWPRFSAINTRSPSIRIATTDCSQFSTLTLTGAAQGATDSVVYLRKVAEGGTRVADGTSEHISFTIDEGRIHCQPLSGSHGQIVGTEILITPTYDGTEPVVAIDTTAAIS